VDCCFAAVHWTREGWMNKHALFTLAGNVLAVLAQIRPAISGGATFLVVAAVAIANGRRRFRSSPHPSRISAKREAEVGASSRTGDRVVLGQCNGDFANGAGSQAIGVFDLVGRPAANGAPRVAALRSGALSK
jgi:hypothetical protein